MHRHINRNNIASILTAGNVVYRRERAYDNGFLGDRYIFPNRSQASKAATVLGVTSISRYFKEYAIALY